MSSAVPEGCCKWLSIWFRVYIRWRKCKPYKLYNLSIKQQEKLFPCLPARIHFMADSEKRKFLLFTKENTLLQNKIVHEHLTDCEGCAP